MTKKRLVYEKPMAVDMGSLAPVHGADCASGFAATNGCLTTGHKPDDQCISGNDPDLIPYCEATGATATADCQSNGNYAGSNCMGQGGTASVACIPGAAALYGYPP